MRTATFTPRAPAGAWAPRPPPGARHGAWHHALLARDRAVQRDLLGDDRADAADALADLVLGRAGEVEAHRALAGAPVGEGGDAGDEGDVLAERAGQEVGGVDVVGERRPQEQAALGLGPGRLGGEVLLERLEHRVAAGAVDVAELVHVLAPAALGEELVDEVLRERRGAEVGRLLSEHDLGEDRRRRAEPAEAQAGGEDLRERAEVDDVVAAVELVKGRERIALVAKEPVRVVLDNQDLVLARDLDQRRRRSSESVWPAGF